MTETPTTDQPVIDNRVQVHATTNPRLEQLHAAYTDAKANADQATKTLKAITDAIKVELTQAAPERRRIELVGLDGPALQLTYTESWRVDAKMLKAEEPETYVRYAKKSGSWTLALAKGGDE